MPIITPATTTTGLTTAADLVNLTRDRYLLAGATEQRNRLNAPYTAGGGTLTFQYDLRGIQPGAVLSCGLNVFYVWEVDQANNTATVEAAYRGSPEEDAAFGAPVTVNPRWTVWDIFTALNEEIAALSSPGSGLFAMKQTEFTYTARTVGFDLPGVTDLLSVYEVRYEGWDNLSVTPRIARDMWRLERSYLPAENSSGYSLKLFQGGSEGNKVTVLYRAPFLPFGALSFPVADAGIPASALDIPPLGAALRLLVGREVRRNDLTVQGDTRRATEVPPGAVAASWRGLAGQRQQRITEEIARLQAAYPYRT